MDEYLFLLSMILRIGGFIPIFKKSLKKTVTHSRNTVTAGRLFMTHML